MSDYGDGNFMDMVSHWSPPPSPGLSEIFATLDQTDNGLNPISDAFLQTNQPEQRPSLVDRVAARVGRKIPPLRTQNMSPFAPFKNPKTVPLVINISPGWSPSLVLHSPSQLISPYSFSDDELPETVENSGEDHATTMIFNNNVPSQPTHFDLPPQEDSHVIPTENIPSHVDPTGAPLVPSFESEAADDTDITKLLSLDNESKSEDKEYNEDEDKDEDEDDGSADEQEGEPPSPKRRKYEESNTITTTRTSKVRKVTHHMENEEDQPSDDYRWRKYGQKVIKGNPNPRSYYKCSHKGCNVKKHVQRGADDVKTLVVTYDGSHEHPKPVIPSSNSSGPKNRSGSSVPAPLDMPPFSSFSATRDMRPFPYPSTWAPFPYPSALAPQDKRPFPSSLNPGVDMTHLYMSGLSKLPSVPVNQNHGCMGQNGEPWVNQNHGCMGQNGEPWVNQNHGFMGQNNEPKTDHVIPDGTELYKGIMERLMANYVKR